MKQSLILIVTIFSLHTVNAQVSGPTANGADALEASTSPTNSRVSVGLDVFYLAWRGFAPIVVDWDFSDYYSAQVGFGPTLNDGLIALAFNADYNGDIEIDYKVGFGGFGRIKAYYHHREDRVEIWAPYAAMGYQRAGWVKEWLNTSFAPNEPYERDTRIIAGFQFFGGLRKQYTSLGYIDISLGVLVGTNTIEEINLATAEVQTSVSDVTTPIVNVMFGFYVD